MAKNDILGTNKVRTQPEYVAKTHWAGSLNFAAIFTAPIFYLLLPTLLLYVTGCFKLCADLINQIAGSVIFDQYGVMGIVALVLWQVVVCWVVWRGEIKKYEDAPKYEYSFYNDIVEYKKTAIPTPKFVKVIKLLINFIPMLVGIAIAVAFIIFIAMNLDMAPEGSAPSTTPGGSGSSTAPDTGASDAIDWAAVWAMISGALTAVMNFVTNEENLPIVIAIGAALAVGLLILIICAIFKKTPEKPASSIEMKKIDARTIPAVICASKKLPAPAYTIPDNCPRWLKKIIFWAPVHYNFGDVIITSPRGMEDDVILSKIEKPEELIRYLNPIKPEPTEVASYGANR